MPSPRQHVAVCMHALVDVSTVQGHACRALDKVAAPEDKPPAKEVLQLRKELFERMGWAHWARQEASRIKEAFPAAYPLF